MQNKPSHLSDFEILNKLGQGSFSEVFKVRRKCDNEIYAMKKVKLGMLKEKEKQNALNEVRILASLDHKYVIGYIDAFYEEETNILCIIMEHAEGGDIQKLIKQKNKTNFFSEEEIWSAIVDITNGLKTLHDQQILHRDLKSANVFVTKEGVYKIGDLNVSKIAKRGLVYTQTGTPYYASPEVWRDEPYDAKSDIWSFGCIIYEMCTLKPPFTGHDMGELFIKIQQGQFASIPNRYSNALQSFIKQLLRLNASSRPSCDQILQSHFLKENCSQLLQQQDERPSNLKLLKTIRLSKHGNQFKGLSERLPESKYKVSKLNEDKENLNSAIFAEQLRQEQIAFRQRKRSYVQLDSLVLKINKSSKEPSVLNKVSLPTKENRIMPQQPHFSNITNAQERVNDYHQVRHQLYQNGRMSPSSKHHRISSEVDLPINDRNRQHRINSVAQDLRYITPFQLSKKQKEIKLVRPLSYHYNHQNEIQSLNLQDRSKMQRQISINEKPSLYKQHSDLTPFKLNESINQNVLTNLPYLQQPQQKPPIIKYLAKEQAVEQSQVSNSRKVSPFIRPKVAVPSSSPFHIARHNEKSKQENIFHI